MGTLDLIILGILLIAAVMGAVKGFIGQIGTLAGIILGVIACRMFGGAVADMIVGSGTAHEGVYRAVVYILLFIAVYFVVFFIARMFSNLLSAMHIRIIDRIGGAVLSMAAWAFFMSLALNVYFAISPADRGAFSTQDKPWRPAIAQLAPRILGYITT